MSTAAERLVKRSTREQGLPVTVTDPATLHRIATLLAANGEGAPKGARTNLPDATTRKVGPNGTP